jgi:hypothetical protein
MYRRRGELHSTIADAAAAVMNDQGRHWSRRRRPVNRGRDLNRLAFLLALEGDRLLLLCAGIAGGVTNSAAFDRGGA